MPPQEDVREAAAAQEVPQEEEGAPEAAAREIQELINAGHLAELRRLQLQILGGLQDGNAVLAHVNDFAARSLAAAAADFARHTRQLAAMRADLDHVFKRVRTLKEKLQKAYPEAVATAVESVAAADGRPDLEQSMLPESYNPR